MVVFSIVTFGFSVVLPVFFGETGCSEKELLLEKRFLMIPCLAKVRDWGCGNNNNKLRVGEMGVSKNRGTPKWMVYNGKPY